MRTAAWWHGHEERLVDVTHLGRCWWETPARKQARFQKASTQVLKLTEIGEMEVPKRFVFKSFLKLMMKIGQHWIFIRNWNTNVVLGVNSIWNGMTLMWGCRQGRVRPGPSGRGWQSNEVLVIPSLSWEDLNHNPDYFKVRSTWFVVEFQTGQAFRLWLTIGGSVGFNVFWREL